MKFSKFIHLLEIREDIVAIFHSISLATIYTKIPKIKLLKYYSNTPTEIIKNEFISNGDSKLSLYNKLITKKFFVSENYSEKQITKNIFELNTSKLNINTAYFLITNTCNLSCKYCVVVNNKKIKNSQTMQPEMITKYLNYFYKNHDKNAKEINITIYGGEPLLYPDIIEKIWSESIRIFNKYLDKLNFIILTNSLLIDEKKLELLKKNKVQVVVSLDGDEETTNANRVDKKGHGVYKQIIKKLQILKKNNINYSISCTIGIGNENKTFSTFKHIAETAGTKDIGLNYIMDIDNYDRTDENYARAVTEGLIKIHEKYHKTNFYEDRLARKIKAYTDKTPIIKDCTGCGKQIVFTPDNKIGPCQSFYSENMYFHDFEDNLDLTNLSFSEWNKLTPFNKSECLDCIALGSCGGGCPYRTFKNKQDISSNDDVFCIHSKMLIKHLIEFSYLKSAANKTINPTGR